MRDRYRLNFIVDEAAKLVIIRPIGDMPAMEFVEQVFARYSTMAEPWNWRRVNDFRRFEGFLDQAALTEIARRWAELTQGITYTARVAVVTIDPLDHIRLPAVSPQFPNEIICVFSDYHEAVGWLLSETPDTYLAGLAEVRQSPRDTAQIIIE